MADRINRQCAVAALLVTAGLCVAMPIRGHGHLRTITAAPSPGGGANPPADANIGQDIQYINRIYRQIGMSFIHASDVQIIGAASYGNPTGANGLFTKERVPGAIHMYYVNQYTGVATAATWGAEDVASLPAAQRNPGIITNPYTNNFNTGRMIDTMAHELGHMLMDTWRFRNAEGNTNSNGMIHSTYVQDVMSPSNQPRNIPGNLNQVWPGGPNDQIRRQVGYYDVNAAATHQNKKVPMHYAMFRNSNQGLITVDAADQIKVGIDNGAGLVDTGMYDWNAARTPEQGAQYLDLGGGRHVQVYEGAQRMPNNEERLSFHFYSDLAWGNATPSFKMMDIDSVDAPVEKYLGYVGLSSIVEVSPDFTTDGKVMDGPGANLVDRLVSTVDYNIASVFNASTGKLESFTVQIIRAGALNGMKDIVISFNLQIPTPGAATVLFLAGLVAARRRR
jgi:hypothetical protein